MTMVNSGLKGLTHVLLIFFVSIFASNEYKKVLFMKNSHLPNLIIRLTEHLPQHMLHILCTYVTMEFQLWSFRAQ